MPGDIRRCELCGKRRMSLQNWKERYNPILVLCIAVAFCAALYLMQIRVGIEKRNDTVEQTLARLN